VKTEWRGERELGLLIVRADRGDPWKISIRASSYIQTRVTLLLSTHVPAWSTEELLMQKVVPCAHYFSFEANIYVCGFSGHARPPFLLPPPFPTSFSALGCSSELKTTTVRDFVRETSLGNSVSGPGGVPGHRGPPTWRPRGAVSLSLLVFSLREVVPAWDVGATSEFIGGGGLFLFLRGSYKA
jgi:hypothetical protein